MAKRKKSKKSDLISPISIALILIGILVNAITLLTFDGVPILEIPLFGPSFVLIGLIPSIVTGILAIIGLVMVIKD